MPGRAGVANPRQHVGDRVGHVHRFVLVSSATVRSLPASGWRLPLMVAAFMATLASIELPTSSTWSHPVAGPTGRAPGSRYGTWRSGACSHAAGHTPDSGCARARGTAEGASTGRCSTSLPQVLL